jgi:hypothetical protein
MATLPKFEKFEVIRSMSKTMVAMPVTVEQIAAAIKQMDQAERERLFALVADSERPATIELQIDPAEAQAMVEEMRAELLEALGGEYLSSDEPFLGGLTLGEYFDLPDEERGRLWDEWSGGSNWMDNIEEVDVPPTAVPAR